jgi:sugar phosphate isomerase/epimerase
VEAKIGIQLYAVKDPWAADPVDTLERIAALGIQGVEAAGLGEAASFRHERIERSRLLRRRVDEAGLELSGAHTVLPMADDADWLFEEMVELQVPIAIASTPERVLGFTRDVFDDIDRLHRFADRLNALASIGRRHGIRLGYHNHWWEWTEHDGRPAYEMFIEALDPDIAIELDLFWAQSAGQDLPQLVSSLGSRVEYVHVKDGNGVLGVPQVAAGAGEIRLAEALDSGRDTIRWQILELDLIAPDADIWDVVGLGARWLQDRRA